MGLDPSVKGLHNVIICEDGEVKPQGTFKSVFLGLQAKTP